MPLYMHLIDASRPEAPRVSTLRWAEQNGHLRAQAVADRWYVLVDFARTGSSGHYLLALSRQPPLRVLERREIFFGPELEFRVHERVLYWLDEGDRVLLHRRRVKNGTTPSAVDLGPADTAPFERRGVIEVVGNRLYVAAPLALFVYDVHPSRAPVRVRKINSSPRSSHSLFAALADERRASGCKPRAARTQTAETA